MSEKESPDVVVARELNLPPDAVRQARLAWNNNPHMKGIFTHRLNGLMRERQQALEKCKMEELAGLQKEIAALRLTLSIITETQK